MQIPIATKRVIQQPVAPWVRPGLTVADLFGPHEKKMRHLHKTVESFKLAKELQKLIEPRLKALEKLAGQELNATYLAYFVMNVLNQNNK